MKDSELLKLIESNLYNDIIFMSDGKNVSLKSIEDGILFFLLRYDNITKEQRSIIIRKALEKFGNEIQNNSKEKIDKTVKYIEELGI